MLIQAYRRKEPITVDLFGETIQFETNDAGAVVADVEDERAIERLLSIDDAYTQYVAAGKDKGGGADPLVLVNDAGETLDIGKMTAKQIRAIAQESGVELPGSNGTPVAELRQLLADGLRARG